MLFKQQYFNWTLFKFKNSISPWAYLPKIFNEVSSRSLSVEKSFDIDSINESRSRSNSGRSLSTISERNCSNKNLNVIVKLIKLILMKADGK